MFPLKKQAFPHIHRWARGRKRGGIPPGRPKKCSPQTYNLFTTVTPSNWLAAGGGGKILFLLKNAKILVAIKKIFRFCLLSPPLSPLRKVELPPPPRGKKTTPPRPKFGWQPRNFFGFSFYSPLPPSQWCKLFPPPPLGVQNHPHPPAEIRLIPLPVAYAHIRFGKIHSRLGFRLQQSFKGGGKCFQVSK